MADCIGIHLGQSDFRVAALNKTERPVVLQNKNKSASPDGLKTASAVRFKDGQAIVGEQARKCIGLSANVAARFQRLMGSSENIDVGGLSFTPTELTALILGEAKKIAGDNLSHIGKAVIAIPANLSNEAREATMKAALLAGLEVERIVDEPAAAVLHYVYKNKEIQHGHYAVYDLGECTFDISVVSIDGSRVDVITSNGIAKLGGMDFDAALRGLVEAKYKKETGGSLDPELYTLADAQEDKIKLSEKKRVLAGGIDEHLDDETIFITRSEFEEAISSLIAQAEMTCEATLSEAGLGINDIKGVILAGGSTRMPVIRESVKRMFKQAPIITKNSDEMVALGAVLYADVKGKGKEERAGIGFLDGVDKTQDTSAIDKFLVD